MHRDHRRLRSGPSVKEALMGIPTSEESYGLPYPDRKQLITWRQSQRACAGRNLKLHRDEGYLFFESAGRSPYWWPKNTHVYNAVTPNMYADSLWEPDGRLEEERTEMLTASCSGHCLLYGHQVPSYADLPIKHADFGVLHRSDGACSPLPLPYLYRFTEDDSHIFCRQDQIAQEIKDCFEFLNVFYGKIMDFTFEVHIATRARNFAVGGEEIWNKTQEILESVVRETGNAGNVKEGAAPYYGPRIEITIRDVHGRYHLLARIQLDFELPERFDLVFTSEDGCRLRPILIHRSIVGPAETLLAITDSECCAYWPFWMSPSQVVVIPVSVVAIPYARMIQQQLTEANFEVDADLSCIGSLNRRIKNAIITKCNFILVVGKNEAMNGTVNVRTRNDTVEVFVLHFQGDINQ
ncbi:anticodon binding domain protein [Necator americanus]|uniref:threonine--tRNA ligase n=1 Tax=Necator americanus TaxID=51031 RepID=W2TZD8_NECAM|nr:anticodon binding domain protein [Necator americanus]ETN86387.1 anticodon binding domain protein [Necator americanus]